MKTFAEKPDKFRRGQKWPVQPATHRGFFGRAQGRAAGTRVVGNRAGFLAGVPAVRGVVGRARNVLLPWPSASRSGFCREAPPAAGRCSQGNFGSMTGPLFLGKSAFPKR